MRPAIDLDCYFERVAALAIAFNAAVAAGVPRPLVMHAGYCGPTMPWATFELGWALNIAAAGDGAAELLRAVHASSRSAREALFPEDHHT